MTEKEIQDAKTASDKKELERRYVAKKYPLNLKGFEAEQAQARYNYYANKVLSKMDSATYSNLKKGMPAKVTERQAYIDKFAKDNPKFYTKDLANIITPEGVADMTAQRDIIERNRGLHTLGTKEEAEAFGTRHAALIEDARVHRGYSNDPNSEIKYIISWDPEKGYKADVEDFKFGTKVSAPREEDLRQIAIDIEKDRILNTPKEKDLADAPELKNGLDFSSVSAYNKWLAFGHASEEFDKTPGNQTISIKGKRKDVKHKLVNGIDTTMTPMEAKGVTPVAGKSNLAVDSKTLAKSTSSPVVPTDETTGAGGESMVGEAVNIASQAMPLVADATSLFGDGESAKTVAATGGTALSGASLGMVVGGPVGATIGGVAGGVLGFAKDFKNKKAAERAKKEAEAKYQKALVDKHTQPIQNTQAPMYENGVQRSPKTEEVEVEKDELVLRKNALGKYVVVADFKGGKTHAQGGEEYTIKEGDVVFPGKKRSKIMSAIKSGNHYAIETERMRLPKTMPDNKLKEGINTLPMIKGNDWWNSEKIVPQDTPKTPDSNRSLPNTSLYGDKIVMPNDLYTKPSASSNNNSSNKKNTKDKSTTPKDKSTESKEQILEALQYAPAISNMLKGMQKPETVDRRYTSADQYKYKDLSGDIRKEINTQAAIDADNASRFSGGSAQVARIAKAQAAVNRLKRLQEINAGEAKRADAISQANVDVRNSVRDRNLELSTRYDEADAQNRAAIDAYFDRGVYDFGRIASQISIDKKAEKNQDIILDMLEKENYRFDKKTKKWVYKGK